MFDHKPLFSIIIPIYNVEQYLAICLDSVCKQTYRNLEIILVDDGSLDRCGILCDEYEKKDSRIKVIHKANGGLVSARQAGASICTGDYVINVDSDDYIAHDLLEKVAEIIKKYQPDAILYDCIRFKDNQQTLLKNTLRPGLYTDETIKQVYESIILDSNNQYAILYNLVTKVAKRDLYVACQMAVPVTIVQGEDLAVTAPMLSNCNSAYISSINGYYYRNNPKSIMNTFRFEEILSIKELAKFLSKSMAGTYQKRIDSYVLLRYFDFLERAMQSSGYRQYKTTVQETLDDELLGYLQRASCPSRSIKERIVYFLIRHQWMTVMWLLEKIKNGLRQCLRDKSPG